MRWSDTSQWKRMETGRGVEERGWRRREGSYIKLGKWGGAAAVSEALETISGFLPQATWHFAHVHQNPFPRPRFTYLTTPQTDDVDRGISGISGEGERFDDPGAVAEEMKRRWRVASTLNGEPASPHLAEETWGRLHASGAVVGTESSPRRCVRGGGWNSGTGSPSPVSGTVGALRCVASGFLMGNMDGSAWASREWTVDVGSGVTSVPFYLTRR